MIPLKILTHVIVKSDALVPEQQNLKDRGSCS